MMPISPEIIALIDKPHLLFAVLAVGAIIGVTVDRGASKTRRRTWPGNKRNRWRNPRTGSTISNGPWHAGADLPGPKQLDAADQLRIVMGSSFTIQPLLNKYEARVFKELDHVVTGRNPAWQVMAQVSLGEILRSKDPGAFGCINSKRVDLLLVDGDCRPRHALEYQGGGHYQGTAAARDAVKKEALRRAGIGYHEVVASHTTPSDLRRLVEKLVDKPN